MKQIYLDNAATSFPKPDSVAWALSNAVKNLGNPGRGAHKISLKASDTVYECRETAADFFGAQSENVVFTKNATEALNYAIKGLIKKNSHVLIDSYAHNAALRPLVALANEGFCKYDVCNSGSPIDIINRIKSETSAIIITHASNICSYKCDLEKIGKICREYGLTFIVDASQSAGHYPINIEQMGITALCLPGHKGLFSPMGVGMLISAPGTVYRTILEGGAGINSLDKFMPDDLPERLEAGTIPVPAIAGLLEGIRFVKKIGIEEIRKREVSSAQKAVRLLSELYGIRFYGDTSGSVFSFNIDGIAPSYISNYLAERNICVRSGYHCAPLAHTTVGSIDSGSVRVSYSYFNRENDAEHLRDAVYECINSSKT